MCRRVLVVSWSCPYVRPVGNFASPEASVGPLCVMSSTTTTDDYSLNGLNLEHNRADSCFPYKNQYVGTGFCRNEAPLDQDSEDLSDLFRVGPRLQEAQSQFNP
ncbi:hypothetical protein BDZ89DRAFT_1059138 [Hymenopellis radicata]|nr:hypothetical protein BDZ89DRAFT_1059138 [Hymenopellis radicata]